MIAYATELRLFDAIELRLFDASSAIVCAVLHRLAEGLLVGRHLRKSPEQGSNLRMGKNEKNLRYLRNLRET